MFLFSTQVKDSTVKLLKKGENAEKQSNPALKWFGRALPLNVKENVKATQFLGLFAT